MEVGEVGEDHQGQFNVKRPEETSIVVVVIIVQEQLQQRTQGCHRTESRERGRNQRRLGGSETGRQGQQGRQAMEQFSNGPCRGGHVAQSCPLGRGSVADVQLRVPAVIGQCRWEEGHQGLEGRH